MRILFPAAALAAAVLFAGCAQQNGGTDDALGSAGRLGRVEVGTPASLRPGIIFSLYGKAEESARVRTLEEEMLWLAEQSEIDITESRRAAIRRIAEKLASLSLDELTWSAASALEATFSQVILIGFARALEKEESKLFENLDAMSSSYHADPTRIETEPLGLSIIRHRIVLHGAVEMFALFPPPSDLAGRYSLSTSANCPVAGGHYEFVQRGRIFELVDDTHIVMFGAIGATHAFFVPNDQRYAAITVTAGRQIYIQYPDRNADIMPAKLGQPDTAIVMHNRPVGDCVMMLRPLDSET